MLNNNLIKNLVVQLLVFSISLTINFFLTPFIAINIGIEAYGFTLLANQLINIFSIVMITLNSMAGRFISIAYHRNEIEKANKYFSSIIFSNWIFVIIFFIPAILIVIFLESFINIPSELLIDVKILYLILFFNYLIGLLFSTYSVSTFIANKIYLASLRSLESNLIRIIIIFLLFYFSPPFLFFIGLSTAISRLYVIFFDVYYKRKLIPNIIFSKRYFSLSAIVEVSKSGFWNLIIRIGQLLNDGFDLLISNLFLGPLIMGIFALSKTIPTVIVSLVGTLVFIFTPNFTKLYAENNITELKIAIKNSIKIMGLLVNIPIALLFVYGKEFYALWLPNSDFQTIYLLSSISLATIVVSGSLNSLYGVFTVTNRLKVNSISVILNGLIAFSISLVLLNFTNLGVYSIVISSGIVGILRNLVITLPLSAKYLGLKWNTFYIDLGNSLLTLFVALVVGIFIKSFFEISSWLILFFNFGVTSLLAFLINLFIILTKTERLFLFNKILRKEK
jgi:O-antigen/teichoic acid export membrane protein